MTKPSDGLRVECPEPGIVHIQLDRVAKRNAIDDSLLQAIEQAFAALDPQVRAVLLSGCGDHFCAGLDLSELSERSVAEGIGHSRAWHRAFEQVQFGAAPVVAVLHGAVVGGGLELAAAAHVRVAEQGAMFALPEGQRGLFVGGGGSARIPRLIGHARMTDMMLTGRVLDADEALAAGLVQYRVAAGEGLAKGLELARRIAANAPLSNFAVQHALPRIADMPQSQALFVESLMAAIAQGDEAAKARLRDFLEGRADRVRRPQ